MYIYGTGLQPHPPRHGHGSPSLWECVGVSPCTGPQTGTIFTHTYIYTHIYIYIHIGIIYMKRFRQLCCINVAADAVRAHSFVLLANSLRLKACWSIMLTVTSSSCWTVHELCVGQCCYLTRPLNLLEPPTHCTKQTLLKRNHIMLILLDYVLISVQGWWLVVLHLLPSRRCWSNTHLILHIPGSHVWTSCCAGICWRSKDCWLRCQSHLLDDFSSFHLLIIIGCCAILTQQLLDLILGHGEWQIVEAPHIDLFEMVVDHLFCPLLLDPCCQVAVASDPVNCFGSLEQDVACVDAAGDAGAVQLLQHLHHSIPGGCCEMMEHLCSTILQALEYEPLLLLCWFHVHVGHLARDVVGPHPVLVPLEIVADLLKHGVASICIDLPDLLGCQLKRCETKVASTLDLLLWIHVAPVEHVDHLVACSKTMLLNILNPGNHEPLCWNLRCNMHLCCVHVHCCERQLWRRR